MGWNLIYQKKTFSELNLKFTPICERTVSYRDSIYNCELVSHYTSKGRYLISRMYLMETYVTPFPTPTPLC